MDRPTDPREALRAFIDFWVSEYALARGTKRERVYASFDYDITVLHDYLNAYAEADVEDTIWRLMKRDEHYIPDSVTLVIGRVREALLLPSMLRIDARDEEAVRWARVFLPFRGSERQEYLLKSRPLVAAKHFHQQGVSPEFARLFYKPDMTRTERDAVIALYDSGITYEYACALLDEDMLSLTS